MSTVSLHPPAPLHPHATVPLNRQLNSWSMRPAELTFLPLGVHLTPVLYSSRGRRASLIDPRHDLVRLGRHDIDGRLIEVAVTHEGTTLALTSCKSDPFCVEGGWQCRQAGEWGLRFWVSLCLWADSGAPVDYRPERGAAVVAVNGRFVAVKTSDTPVQVTGHDDLASLAGDFEAKGYFDRSSRAASAPLIALRFNLEMMPTARFALAVADDPDLAIDRAEAQLAAPATPPPLPEQTGPSAGALDAVRDVVAWNTIWDPVNHRPYTTVSRIWNLGTFAVWYNDQTFAALMAGLFDGELARENMAVALAGATPQGNIACIVTSKDAWVDRSQPPHGAFVAWMLYLRHRDLGPLQAAYPALAANQRWWRRERDPEGRGLVSCGSSAVGSALYAGTAFGARNETGMDNSATHDEAVYDPETRSLSTFDLGLNCALALDAEMLAEIATVLGRPEEAAEFSALAAQSRDLIRRELWDEERQIFANRQRRGGFVRSLSPTSFYPLLCGAATEAQAAALLRHLQDPTRFAGRYGLPNATRDDPAFGDNVYWRGRIWPNVNYFVWQGLRRYGFQAEARALARMSHELFRQSWDERRIAAENYHADSGEPLDQPDTDPFYIWGAMLPLMAVGEVMEIDPWHGWTLVNDGEDLTLGPVLSPLGPVSLAISAGQLSLYQGGRALLITTGRGRLTRLVISPGLIAVTLDHGGRLDFPAIPAATVVAARLDGADLPWQTAGDGISLTVPPLSQPARLTLHHSPAAIL